MTADGVRVSTSAVRELLKKGRRGGGRSAAGRPIPSSAGYSEDRKWGGRSVSPPSTRLIREDETGAVTWGI
ncbi:MAG: hypothetical protein ACLRSW_15945 [Christensenellaceae bacterium]